MDLLIIYFKKLIIFLRRWIPKLTTKTRYFELTFTNEKRMQGINNPNYNIVKSCNYFNKNCY